LNLKSAAWVSAAIEFFEMHKIFKLQSTKRKGLNSKYSPAYAENTTLNKEVSQNCKHNALVKISSAIPDLTLKFSPSNCPFDEVGEDEREVMLSNPAR
jgi:hypothetical protein